MHFLALSATSSRGFLPAYEITVFSLLAAWLAFSFWNRSINPDYSEEVKQAREAAAGGRKKFE